MKREVGLWIDHHKTVMVTMVSGKEETRIIRSNIEKYIRTSVSPRAKKPANLPAAITTAEGAGDRRFGNHLVGYYAGVVSMLRNADSIWIFGPGEAKVELENQLKREELDGRIVGIETASMMTDRQIEAKVRAHYPK